MDKLKRNYAPLFIAGTAVFFLATAYRFVFKKESDTISETAPKPTSGSAEQNHHNVTPMVTTHPAPQTPVIHRYE